MTGVERIKTYWGAALSLTAVAGYFSPWYAADAHAALGFYVLAFLWFLLPGWVELAINLVAVGRKLKRKEPEWKHPASAACITALCYAAVWTGIFNGYMVTV
jgi:hypothetical protein